MRGNLIFWIIVALIFYSYYALAQELKTIEVPRIPIKCPDGICTISLDDLDKLAKYEVENEFKVSSDLLYVTQKNRYHSPSPPICAGIISPPNENYYVFDFKLYKNGLLEKDVAYIDFRKIDENSTKMRASLFCYEPKINDTIILDYKYGGKIIPVTENLKIANVTIGNITRTPFLYPFDKYFFTSWSQPNLVYFKRTDKVILPNAFERVKDETSFSCPVVAKNRLVKGNITLVETTLFLTEYGFEESFVQVDNNRVIIFLSGLSSPRGWVLADGIVRFNLTSEQQENIMDDRTGCFLKFTFQRIPIVVYLFLISSLVMLILSIYFITKRNYRELLSSVFLIWAFQEGINQLLPLLRPTIVTIFDLNIIYIPLLAFLIVYREEIKSVIST